MILYQLWKALTTIYTRKTLGKHLNALHAGRQAFIMAETSERIRCALRHQVRPTGRIFQSGERVYFKRDNEIEWEEPGTIIGQDGKTVIIKHGSYTVKSACIKSYRSKL